MEEFRGDLLAHYDPARASLRTWLHSIATNACLTALEGRARRPLPTGLGPAGDDPHAPLTPNPDIPWLQPFPDARLAEGDPADAVQQRAALRLAFVAPLQLLPARQRAALVLCEVLQLSAAEVAGILDTSVASVTSGLQRARSTLKTAAPTADTLRDPVDPGERAVVDRYLKAFEAADLDGLARLLADDVILEMPPVPLWLAGRAHYREFVERVFARRGTDWRLQPVRANGSPALAAYVDGRAHSLQVFTVRGGLVRHCVTFADPTLFAGFGLALGSPA